MLVLARQKDQSIMIGDDVEVMIVDIRGDKVRLGINAKKEVSVHRKEIYDLIREQAEIKPTPEPAELDPAPSEIEIAQLLDAIKSVPAMHLVLRRLVWQRDCLLLKV